MLALRREGRKRHLSVLVASRVVLGVIQVILYAGCLVLNYLASHRVGVAHHITATSVQWEHVFDVHAVIVVATVFLAACVVVLAVCARHRRGAFRGVLLLVVCAGVFCLFAFAFSRENVRSYYYICLIMYVAAILQAAKVVLALRERRSRRQPRKRHDNEKE